MIGAAQISPFLGIATLGQRLSAERIDASETRPTAVQALERFGRATEQPRAGAPFILPAQPPLDAPQPEAVARAYRPARDAGRDETTAPVLVRAAGSSAHESTPEASSLTANLAYRRRVVANRGLDRPAGRLVNLSA